MSQASGEDVVQHAELWDEVVLLVDNAYEFRELPSRSEVGEAAAIQFDVAGIGLGDAG